MIVGIITEYNPFHNGHLYQINKIRATFGEETQIVAVMSGNFTQRGGVAIADKSLRARCALLCGVNLVLELPFPYSMSSAEFFAQSGVHILNALGCVDYLCFGSESGEIESLTTVAEAMLTDEYHNELKSLLNDANTKKMGYPQMCEAALNKVIKGGHSDITFTPNNILAIEYIKALIKSNSDIRPFTIARQGNDFSSKSFVDGDIQSATSIRSAIYNKDISALEYVPDITRSIILDSLKSGDFPCDEDKLSTAVISHFRLNSPNNANDIHDASGGLYNRLKELSFETNNIENLVSSAESKKFTRARIRRAIFNSFLGVTSSQIKELPMFTQLLATDDKGRAILKAVRNQGSISILTKPSDTDALLETAKLQKKLSDSADSIFQLTKPMPKSGNSALRFTPFVKK